ncbi:MAG: hypothetical protein IPM61_01230 [Chlorobi bacterium]|nr:hypothetical protein [Chlorobiota bacterium]MBX7218143.1 hypothetical protein [Candidatus Kapabacteria bacterium]
MKQLPSARNRWVGFLAIMATAMATIMAACGQNSPDDSKPSVQQGYTQMVETMRTGDGAKIYDLFDSDQQHQLDMMLAGQTMNMSLDSARRQEVEVLQGLKGKEAFAKYMQLYGEDFTGKFQGDFEVLQVDTLYSLVVRHKDRPAEILMMRWENGAYKVAAPPNPQAVAQRVDAGKGKPSPVPPPSSPAPGDTAR